MMPALPYELIGKVTVFLLTTLVITILLFGLWFTILFVWVRGWVKVVNLMWRGYDPVEGPPPPSPRREIAIIAYGLKRFKRPSEIHEAIKKAHGKDP